MTALRAPKADDSEDPPWVRACIPVVDRSTIRNPESVATWSMTPPSATG
jgi:hypothetical protein